MQCIAASIAGVKIDYHEPNAVKADKGWMKTFLSALPKESTIASIIELLSATSGRPMAVNGISWGIH